MTEYTIYTIKTFNNDNLVFYNYTKQKRINDVLSSYKSRYKRYLNKCDNFMNIFYILQADKSYIKIEEKFTTDNEDNVKSKLYDYIANNNCINKLDTDQIEILSNKTEITENEKLSNKTEITENENLSNKTEITENENIVKVIEEPTITENEIQNNTEPIIVEVIEPTTSGIVEPTNTETKIVKYLKEDIADISNNQVELLNDTITEINEPTTSGIVNEPTNIVNEPSNNVKVVKNLADVKCIDKIYEPSITSSSRHSRPSFKQQLEQLKPKYNKTIKFDYSDVVKIMNNKKTLKKHKKEI